MRIDMVCFIALRAHLLLAQSFTIGTLNRGIDITRGNEELRILPTALGSKRCSTLAGLDLRSFVASAQCDKAMLPEKPMCPPWLDTT